MPTRAVPVDDQDTSLMPSPFEAYIPKDYKLADTMYEHLREQIAEFEADLAPDEEVGANLTHFGKDITIAIEDLSYHNPSLIIFYGTMSNGHRVKLLQHMTQVNVLLVAMKVKPGETARRIGFKSEASGETPP